MPPSGQPAGGEGKRCTHCGSSHTSGYWRSHPTSGQRLCNACGKYADNHGVQLPPDSVLQRRPAQPRRRGTRDEIAQRRCLQCGSASPGSSKRAKWNRHPATGEEWLCHPCHMRARRQLRKQQRRQAEAAAAEEEQQQPGHGSGVGDAPEGEQAPSPQPLPVSRKRRQEQQGWADEAAAAFHDGPAAAAQRRADGRRQPEVGSGGVVGRCQHSRRQQNCASLLHSLLCSGGSGARRRSHSTCRRGGRSHNQQRRRHLPPACKAQTRRWRLRRQRLHQRLLQARATCTIEQRRSRMHLPCRLVGISCSLSLQQLGPACLSCCKRRQRWRQRQPPASRPSWRRPS